MPKEIAALLPLLLTFGVFLAVMSFANRKSLVVEDKIDHLSKIFLPFYTTGLLQNAEQP